MKKTEKKQEKMSYTIMTIGDKITVLELDCPQDGYVFGIWMGETVKMTEKQVRAFQARLQAQLDARLLADQTM